MVERRKARRAPQLPRERVLASPPLERLPEAFLGVGDVGRSSPHEEQLVRLVPESGSNSSQSPRPCLATGSVARGAALWAENQKGETVVTGKAIAVLISRGVQDQRRTML